MAPMTWVETVLLGVTVGLALGARNHRVDPLVALLIPQRRILGMQSAVEARSTGLGILQQAQWRELPWTTPAAP